VPSAFSLFSQIVYVIIAPIFLLMGVGFIVQKRLGFDIRTLTRLNFWLFVPAFLFVRVLESSLSSRDIALVVLHFMILGAILFALTWQVARLIGAHKGLQRAMTSAVIFYNAGNYGVPAAQLAFGAAGIGVQAIVMMLQNTTNFTIGLGLHAGAKSGVGKRDTLRAIWRLPMLQTLIVALLWRWSGQPIPHPLLTAVHYLSDGLVPIALVTLGAQMATLKSFRLDLPIVVTLVLRLIIAPLLAFGLARLMQMPLALTQSLVVAASFPVAVNSALLAIEYDNEPDYSSAVVFYSTLLSVVTVSGTIFLMRLVA
jgi:predicted permease